MFWSLEELCDIVSSTKPMMDRLHCGVPVESWMTHPLASSSYSWNGSELMNVNMAGEEVLPWLGPWMVLALVLVYEISEIWTV